MTIDDKIKEEKIQYDMSREAGKITALSSGKIDKFESVCACVCVCVCVWGGGGVRVFVCVTCE